MTVPVGTAPSGTVIARFLGGTAASGNATSLEYGTVTGGLGGTISFDMTASVTIQYVSAQVTWTRDGAVLPPRVSIPNRDSSCNQTRSRVHANQ